MRRQLSVRYAHTLVRHSTNVVHQRTISLKLIGWICLLSGGSAEWFLLTHTAATGRHRSPTLPNTTSTERRQQNCATTPLLSCRE